MGIITESGLELNINTMARSFQGVKFHAIKFYKSLCNSIILGLEELHSKSSHWCVPLNTLLFHSLTPKLSLGPKSAPIWDYTVFMPVPSCYCTYVCWAGPESNCTTASYKWVWLILLIPLIRGVWLTLCRDSSPH